MTMKYPIKDKIDKITIPILENQVSYHRKAVQEPTNNIP